MDSPTVVIDYNKMKSNFAEIASECIKSNIDLRPHFKAHKTPYISKLQQEWGAIGMTVAKVSEAEVLVDSGIKKYIDSVPFGKEGAVT